MPMNSVDMRFSPDFIDVAVAVKSVQKGFVQLCDFYDAHAIFFVPEPVFKINCMSVFFAKIIGRLSRIVCVCVFLSVL